MKTLLQKIKCKNHTYDYMYDGFNKCEKCVESTHNNLTLKTAYRLINIWYTNNLIMNDYLFYRGWVVKVICWLLNIHCHEEYFEQLEQLHDQLKKRYRLKYQQLN